MFINDIYVDENRKDLNRIFPELENALKKALTDYDALFVKLNWSSPKVTIKLINF